MNDPIILDFTNRRVLQAGDVGYHAALQVHLNRMAKQRMCATGLIPSSKEKP